MAWASNIFAVALLLVSIFIFLPQPPGEAGISSSHRTRQLRGEPLDIPGPVLASRCQNVNLDGLTVIPLVHLPAIKFSLSIPFVTSRKLTFLITTTGSEVIFKTLRIESLLFQAKDSAREPMHLQVSGVQTDFKGSFAVKLRVMMVTSSQQTFESSSTKPSDGPKNVNGVTETKVESWSRRFGGSGRVAARLNDSRLSLSLQLLKSQDSASHLPSVQVLESKIDEGDIKEAHIEGFGVWGGLLTKAIPFIKGTWLIRWPSKVIGDYLARELLEGPVMKALIANVFDVSEVHIDFSSYAALDDKERENLLRTPLDPLIDPIPEDAVSPPPPPTKVKEGQSEPALLAAPSKTNPETLFRFHGHLIGPTVMKNFRLPDFSPELYRPGGTRAKLQSFNLLTSELHLALTDNALASITYGRASVAFDPPKSRQGGGNTPATESIGGGELVVTVQDLQTILKSNFKIHADTSQMVAWATGVKRIGEKGVSTTIVNARSLQLRFLLIPNRNGTGDEVSTSSGSAFSLGASTISPFTTIKPSFQLSTTLLKLGAEVVNMITASLDEQIAAVASIVVRQFMKDAVRLHLQSLMDGVEDTLRVSGVELPNNLRRST